MNLYFGIITILALSGIVKYKNMEEKSKLSISLTLLYIMASIRSLSVGNDTSAYFGLYESNRSLADIFIQERFEVGYLILNLIFRKITSNFYVFLAIINFFIYYAYYLLMKRYSQNYALSVLLFLCFGYWGQTVNVLRVQIAVACFIYMYCLIDSGKISKGIFMGVLGLFFQRISFAYTASFLVPKRINKRFYVMATITTLLLYIYFERIVYFVIQRIPYYGGYFRKDSAYSPGEVSIAIVIKFLLNFIIWNIAMYIYSRNKYRISSEQKQIIEYQINMLYISCLVLILATKFNLIDRCETFYGLFVIQLIPNLLKIDKNKNNARILYIIFIIIAVSYFTIVNIYRPNWNRIYPYHTFFYD